MGFVNSISRTLPTAAKLRIILLTVLILTVPFFIYYLFYIKSQTDYFTNRNFRALARVGSQITTKVESLSGVLKSVGEKFVEPDEFIGAADPADAKSIGEVPRFAPGVKNSERNIEGLKKILKNLKDYGAEIVPVRVTSTTEAEIDRGQNLESKVTVEVRPEDGTMWLYFDLEYAVPDKSNVVQIRIKTDFAKFLEPIVGGGDDDVRGADSEEGFDDLLITQAGGDGRVLFQQRGSELRLVSLEKLPLAGDEAKTVDLSALGQSSSVADVKLAGSEYKLFIHPVDLFIPQTSAENGRSLRWTVCGLVPASRFRREVWAISYSLLIVFAFFTALSILSWPFFKLLLLGPKDRLRTADIYFLFFSTLIGLALLTSFGLYGYSYTALERELDGQLAALGRQVKANFHEEVRTSLAQLDELNKNRALAADLARLGERKRLYRLRVLREPVTGTRRPYPFFDTAVWIDGKGEQRLKWTVKDYQPQFIDVSSRAYVTNLREGRYRYLDGREFWLEPIVSKTTGRNEVEISAWAPAGEGEQQQQQERRWISALDTRLLSLVRPVLPSGFGFCVIDSGGSVLFHSDETRHLGENFFQESDNDGALRSAVIDRREAPLDVRYLGRGHRAFTTPVDDFPDWTVVTYRDKQVLRTAFLELLTLASLLFLGYCIVVLIVLSVFYLLNLNANERRAWLWPSSRRMFSYYVSVLVLFALSAVSALVYSHRGMWSVIVVSTISFLGTCFFFLNLRFGKYGRPWSGLNESELWEKTAGVRRSLYVYDLAYVLNIIFLFLLVAIIPAAAFFKFAYESEITLFVKHGQITLARGLVERQGRIRGQYAATWGEKDRGEKDRAAREDFTRDRLAQTWDVYGNFFFGTTRLAAPAGDLAGGARPDADARASAPDVIHYLSQFTPLYNRTSIERLGLHSGAFADRSYEWVYDTPERAVLRISGEGGNNPSAPRQHLETAIPSLGWPGPAWWGAFFLACVPFYLWVHLMVRKIFLLNLHGPTSYTFFDLAAPEDGGGNRFVILESRYTQRGRFDGGKFHCINLREFGGSPGWADAFDYGSLAASGKVIALDHFEHRASEPEANRQKVRFLEELLTRQHRLLVVSTIEPSRYRFADAVGGANGANGSNSSEDQERWSWVVSNFFTVYMEDKGEPRWFEEELEKHREAVLAEGTRCNKSPEQVGELLRTLKEECNPKSPLQRVGLEIVRQPTFASLTRGHLISRIAIQADTYYQDVWDSCSNDEKLTLYHLAQDRLLSPSDPDIGRLLRKGLIVRDPDIHLMNESFRHFVKSEKAMQAVAEFEKEARKASLWHIIKAPLLVVLISVVLFLFITQRDLYTSSLAIMTAITTAIPAFFKVLSLFQKDPMSQPGQQ
jgi:hypothetical protein